MLSLPDFIKALSDTDKYISDIYTNGGCYKFAKLLCMMYPEATLMVTRKNDHAVVKHNGKYYDITGEVEINDDYHIPTEDDIKECEQWTFGSRNVLVLATCPYCDEPILYSHVKNELYVQPKEAL